MINFNFKQEFNEVNDAILHAVFHFVIPVKRDVKPEHVHVHAGLSIHFIFTIIRIIQSLKRDK